MPVVAIFFGIIIRMFFQEYEPRHFHAEHQALQGKPLSQIAPLE